MSSPEKLIRISRPIIPGDHQNIRSNIERVNHKLSDLQVKWRKLGKTGVTLIDRGEYQRAIEKPGSNLAPLTPETVAEMLNRIIQMQPTEPHRVTPKITDVDFMGEGRFRSIALLLEPDALTEEHGRLTPRVERMCGVNLYWRPFKPHVTIATIEAQNAEDRVLEVFREIAPDEIGLYAVSARPVYNSAAV